MLPKAVLDTRGARVVGVLDDPHEEVDHVLPVVPVADAIALAGHEGGDPLLREVAVEGGDLGGQDVHDRDERRIRLRTSERPADALDLVGELIAVADELSFGGAGRQLHIGHGEAGIQSESHGSQLSVGDENRYTIAHRRLKVN